MAEVTSAIWWVEKIEIGASCQSYPLWSQSRILSEEMSKHLPDDKGRAGTDDV